MRLKKFILTVFALLLTIACFQISGLNVHADETDTTAEDVGYYHKPTKDVKKFFGIWLTTGFALQPKEDSYVVVDNTGLTRLVQPYMRLQHLLERLDINGINIKLVTKNGLRSARLMVEQKKTSW